MKTELIIDEQLMDSNQFHRYPFLRWDNIHYYAYYFHQILSDFVSRQ